MNFRKDTYSLPEVRASVLKLGGSRPAETLLADLQQGHLKAVVEFPAGRRPLLPVPACHWTKRLGNLRYPQLVQKLKRVCTVNDFYLDEENLLRCALCAAAHRNAEDIPVPYRQWMQQNDYLKSEMNDSAWSAVIQQLSECWVAMSELDGRDLLYPVVLATELDRYLKELKSDVVINGKPVYGKHPGGRPENPHWSFVDAEVIRVLAARGSALAAGEIMQVASHVHTRVVKALADAKAPPPKPETIAQRLREICKFPANSGPTAFPGPS